MKRLFAIVLCMILLSPLIVWAAPAASVGLKAGLSDTVTTLDGTGTAGTATTESRGDHEHSVTPGGIGAESATSNDFDPDRIAGDSVDNNTLEGAVLTDGAINAVKAAAIMKISGACIAIGDYSTAIGTGTKWYTAFRIPFKHTLDAVYLTTNEIAGSITIDIWSDAPGATTGLAALTDADSLFDTATEPAIADASSDNYFAVTSFDSGEAANAAGDYYVINVDAAATLTGVSVCFDFTRVD